MVLFVFYVFFWVCGYDEVVGRVGNENVVVFVMSRLGVGCLLMGWD